MAKKDIKALQRLGQALREGPRVPRIKTWGDLVDKLKRLEVTPGEAYRIVADKKDIEINIRFEWKMIRLTFFVWERVKEDEAGYLKPKIDSVKAVCHNRNFEKFFYGYFPDLKFDINREIKLLNKLIAEKPQIMPGGYLSEGYFNYERSKRLIPQKHLNHILWGKK
ncbi:MAG: hypothetical protein H8E55_70570 [Pelagibacterales bacterium]|nr:hypothetical protein [Pelagibacterales bacterium]